MLRLGGSEWRTRLTEFLGGDEEATARHLTTVRENAAAGRFWFVVLMDQLDDRLRELISFVNANSRFKILGVELNFYQHENFEILIPNLYGAEIAKEAAANLRTSAVPSSILTRDSFLEGVRKLGASAAQQLEDLLDWTVKRGILFYKASFGLSVVAVSPKPIFWAYQADGKIELNVKGLISAGRAAYAEKLGRLLDDAGFFAQPAMREMNYPRIPISLWGPKLRDLEGALEQSLIE